MNKNMGEQKVLVIGASGFVGRAVYTIFQDNSHLVYGTYRKKRKNEFILVDINDQGLLKEVFNNIGPNVVILSAALTNVDYCEDHREEAFRVNVLGVKNVARLCKEYDTKLTYISTDYVFDGLNGPYSEDDIPNPISYYGLTKLEGERVIAEQLDDYLIIRTTVIYGWDLESKNFVMSLVKSLKDLKSVKVPVDQYGNPTLVDNLAEGIKELMQRDKRGVYNIVGADYINRYDFAQTAADILGLDKKLLIPVNSEELHQLAKRPKKGGLRMEKIKREIGLRLFGVKDGLMKVKSQLQRETNYARY